MKPESCQGCPYFDRVMVRGQGHPNAQLIIIGQSPGPTEKEEGYPFAGSSGNVLNTALRRADINRSVNYVTNLVKCFVPAGDKVDPLAIRKCAPLLQREFELLPQAKTILTVGKEAFDSLTGKELSVSHNRRSSEKNSRAWLRGCPYPLGDRVIIPTIHPSFVMRSGFLNAPTFEADVLKAGQFASGERSIPTDNFIESPSDQEVGEYIREIISLQEGGIDIETPESSIDEDELDSVMQTPIDAIGLSARIGESIMVRPDQFRLLDELFGNLGSKPVLWAYNAGFDFLHLGKRWDLSGIIPADAMLAFYLLWANLGADIGVDGKKKSGGGGTFDFATGGSYYADFGYYKNWRKLQPERYNTIGNCRDTYGALQIGKNCLAEMRKKKINMEPLFWSIMPIIPILNKWRTTGCNYDVQGSKLALVTLSKTLEAYENWWTKNIPQFDWSSNKQLVDLLRVMNVAVPMKKRPNGETTPCVDDAALETMKGKGVQIAGLVQEMRTLRKAGDFVDLADKDGRVRTRAKLHGQAGGRIQLVNKSLQTIPEKLAGVYPRSYIIPDHPDDLVLVSDFSQAEFFLYAWYTQDPGLLEIHQSGDYCYGFFHEEIWKEPFFEAGKPRQKRFIRKDIEPWKLLVTKSYPLGFTYGRRAVEAKYKWLFDWYHKRFPRVDPFHRELIFQATRDGYLQTVFGRMRRFPNPRGQHNQILAFPGQSTLPDVLIRNAILPLTESLPRLFGERSRTLYSVHDSVYCNIQGAARNIQTAVDAIDHVNSTLSSPIPEMGGFFLRAETKIGPNAQHTQLREKLIQHVENHIGANHAV